MYCITSYFTRYTYPSVETLQKYKVLVTTLVTAGRLASAQFPPEHFTHVFIDEAGQAQVRVPTGTISTLILSDKFHYNYRSRRQ